MTSVQLVLAVAMIAVLWTVTASSSRSRGADDNGNRFEERRPSRQLDPVQTIPVQEPSEGNSELQNVVEQRRLTMSLTTSPSISGKVVVSSRSRSGYRKRQNSTQLANGRHLGSRTTATTRLPFANIRQHLNPSSISLTLRPASRARLDNLILFDPSSISIAKSINTQSDDESTSLLAMIEHKLRQLQAERISEERSRLRRARRRQRIQSGVEGRTVSVEGSFGDDVDAERRASERPHRRSTDHRMETSRTGRRRRLNPRKHHRVVTVKDSEGGEQFELATVSRTNGSPQTLESSSQQRGERTQQKTVDEPSATR